MVLSYMITYSMRGDSLVCEQWVSFCRNGCRMLWDLSGQWFDAILEEIPQDLHKSDNVWGLLVNDENIPNCTGEKGSLWEHGVFIKAVSESGNTPIERKWYCCCIPLEIIAQLHVNRSSGLNSYRWRRYLLEKTTVKASF